MSKMGRILNVLFGLLVVLCGALFILDPRDGYKVVISILAISLILYGIRMFWFYCSMARHMVGGRSMLYRAVIMFDLGLFTISISDIPLIYVILYLAGIHLFTGGVDILRANESRRLQAESWKLQLFQGLVNVILAALCLVFIHSVAVAVAIYGVGLIYSGALRIVQAFRRTAVVYIQ